jgi:hypothetical protein
MDAAPPSSQDRLRAAIDALPMLDEGALPLDDSCPICLLPFKYILHPDSSSARPTPEPDLPLNPDAIFVGPSGAGAEASRGVTKVVSCGHLFCRRE